MHAAAPEQAHPDAEPVPYGDSTIQQQAAHLVALLSARHQGAAKGVCADALATELGVSARRLRRLVSAARENGTAICSQPHTGYYIAVTPDELRQATAFLEHRAMHSLRLLARMRQVSQTELMGQLQLPT